MLLTDSNQGYIENPVPVATEATVLVEASPTPIDLLIKEEKTNFSWGFVLVIFLIVGASIYLGFKRKK